MRKETLVLHINVNSEDNFNPLPPCGRRHLYKTVIIAYRYFNPLPPCGRRQYMPFIISLSLKYFNPLPPCGRRLKYLIAKMALAGFQSTPSMRKETTPHLDIDFFAKFQSTPSMRKETSVFIICRHIYFISIHSLHAEGDCNSIHIIT